jgi:SAM-dependent methyltransferase
MSSTPNMTQTQTQVDQANQAFWEELCGTGLAVALGITDRTAESLRRFDQAYFDFYPYLLEIVRPERMKGKRVVEIGLGFGSLGQKLAEHAEEYIGLDIANKPAESMRHRLQLAGLPGTALQASCHNIPLPAESVDFVVSIGCFHHTGDVQRCLDETDLASGRGRGPDGLQQILAPPVGALAEKHFRGSTALRRPVPPSAAIGRKPAACLRHKCSGRGCPRDGMPVHRRPPPDARRVRAGFLPETQLRSPRASRQYRNPAGSPFADRGPSARPRCLL